MKISGWLGDCSLECKRSYYKRYVDDIFVLFESGIQVESFKNSMNTGHLNMKFTVEKKQSKLSIFLMLKLSEKKMFLPPRFAVNSLLVVFTSILIVTFR